LLHGFTDAKNDLQLNLKEAYEMRWENLIVICGVLGGLPACSTVTRGTSQTFAIESEPSGAKVTFVEIKEYDKDGKSKKTMKLKFTPSECTTPCSVKAKRKPGFIVKFDKEGYEPLETTVASSIAGGGSAGMAGNVLLGGLVGAAVDGSNGSMNELKPNPLKVTLNKVPSPPVVTPAANEASSSVATGQTQSDQPGMSTAPVDPTAPPK
jgi:hypothetical protein